MAIHSWGDSGGDEEGDAAIQTQPVGRGNRAVRRRRGEEGMESKKVTEWREGHEEERGGKGHRE